MKTFLLLISILLAFAAARAADKPVFLYSRYFNAIGEDRYLPDGAYKDVLQRLKQNFEVRVNDKPLTAENLKGVDVVLISNPSDLAAGNNPPPHHVNDKDIAEITKYLEQGGGLIVSGNQEDHNLEIRDMNKLLGRFGIQFTNVFTDAKKLVLPKSTPVIGGLRWAFFTGNLLLLDRSNKANPVAVVTNDLTQKPEKGPRDAAGGLMASATSGKGRVLVFTDSGWIGDPALKGEGIGGVTITEQDNWEIFRRLALWTAGAQK